ncbi:glucose 1-dehydrogenase [Hwanghaeella sp.]|uniref:glucose 1-dehydrogenase n=1 Tax=Hwanghaeella sp. TaxID=2605943 RepID=UPI003CCC272F
MRLQGKTAVVTGAASGFGAEIARSYAREGANVVIADINEEWGKQVAQEIEGINSGNAVFQFADVSRKEDVEGMVDAAVERFGQVDILVNNAGYTHWNMPVDQVPEEEFDRIFAVNVKSIYFGMNAVLPHFRNQTQSGPNKGVVLNIASTAGVRPRPGLVWYNASKSAAIGATRSLAIELGTDNIRVVAINPVAGETPLLAKFMGEDTPEKRAAFKATVPLGRFSQPADIANAAVFLVSDEAEFLTGVCLEVDGGRCI